MTDKFKADVLAGIITVVVLGPVLWLVHQLLLFLGPVSRYILSLFGISI